MRRAATVRILGPIDVWTDDGVISVGGRGPRTVLGVLAIGAGHAVPIHRLQLALWGDAPPASASNTLQSHVSGLRHRLGQGAIVRTDHSYELDIGVVDVDAMRFEALLCQAESARDDPTECRRCCREALGLWRGRPFGELADDEPFTLETHRFEALRSAAMELSMEAELALGHHELVSAELESAVREQPYRERLWYLLIEALARGDRRVEALRACAELRRTLVEVGLDVEENVADLERQLLDGTVPR